MRVRDHTGLKEPPFTGNSLSQRNSTQNCANRQQLAGTQCFHSCELLRRPRAQIVVAPTRPSSQTLIIYIDTPSTTRSDFMHSRHGENDLDGRTPVARRGLTGEEQWTNKIDKTHCFGGQSSLQGNETREHNDEVNMKCLQNLPERAQSTWCQTQQWAFHIEDLSFRNRTEACMFSRRL